MIFLERAQLLSTLVYNTVEILSEFTTLSQLLMQSHLINWNYQGLNFRLFRRASQLSFSVLANESIYQERTAINSATALCATLRQRERMCPRKCTLLIPAGIKGLALESRYPDRYPEVYWYWADRFRKLIRRI